MTQTETTSNASPPTGADDPAFALMKRPFAMTYEQEKQLVEDCRTQLKILVENERQDKEWYSRVTYHGVKVSSKKEGVFCITRGTTQVPEGITLDQIRNQWENDFRNDEVMNRVLKRTDPMSTSGTIVTEIQNKELLDTSQHESLKVLWGNFYVAPLISDRDFVFVQHEMQTKCPVTGEDIFVSSEVSVDLPEAVPDMEKTLGRVRAVLQSTGYVVRPAKDDPELLRITFLGQADPRGYLPASVVNLASVSQALNVGRVRDAHEHFVTVKKQMGGDVDFPFDQYPLARRGGSCSHEVSLVPAEGSTDSKTFFIRLCVHSERNVAVQLELGETEKTKYTLSAVNKNTVGEDLIAGKQVLFGGEKLLDCVLEVALEEGHANAFMNLKFINSGWKQSNVTMPMPMPTSASEPTTHSSAETTDSTAVEQ